MSMALSTSSDQVLVVVVAGREVFRCLSFGFSLGH